MGLIVLEGIIILVLVLTGFRKAVFHAVPQQLKIAISVGIGLFIALIGFVDAGFVTRIPDAFQTTVPVQLGNGGHLERLAGPGLRDRRHPHHRPVGTQGARRDPDLDRRHGRPGVRPPGRPRPRVRRQRRTRANWSLNVPDAQRRFVDVPDFGTLGEFDLFGAFSVGRRAGRAAARLLAAARRLLRHHGHDDGHRRRGRPQRRGGHPAQRAAHPHRRLRRRHRRRRGRRLVQHLLHRVRLRRRRGCPHRPGLGRDRRCCSC